MQITLAGTALSRPATDAQQETTSLELAAFDGEVGNSTVAVPDPTGLDEVVPGLAVVVSEGTTILLDGRIVSEGRERGSSPAAGQKQDTYQVDDPNTFMFGFRVVADRPEESDYARIQWFFDTYLPAADTTFVLNSSTSTMIAASYASDGVADIMRDAIDLTGKTLFIHDKAAGGLCAHWHALTGGHTCGLTISDVFGDPDQVTTWYPQNPARVRDGADLANDILASGADETVPSVTVTDPTSIATYDADGKLHQTFANFPAATDSATLAADAARLLETNKDPRDTFTCTIGPLDDAALALIRAGDIITVTSEVLGLSASPQRISRLRLTVSAGNTAAPGLWDATLTMGAPVRGPGARFGRSAAKPNPGIPAGIGDVEAQGNSAWQELLRNFAVTEYHVPPPGILTFSWPDIGDTHDAFPSPITPVFPFVQGPAILPTVSRLWLQLAALPPSPFHMTGFKDTPDLTPPTAPTVRIRGAVWDQLVDGTYSDTAFPVEPDNFLLAKGDDTYHVTFLGGELASGTFTVASEPLNPVSADFGSGMHYRWQIECDLSGTVSSRQILIDTEDDELWWGYVNFSATNDNFLAVSGRPVYRTYLATSDATTADYTLPLAIKPNTLVVYVDSIPWWDGFVETSPTTFSFLQVPQAGDVIRFSGVAA